ncbi:MAG: hypothetical protein H6672_01630 [Anaerolineaceae bacterium]|nr:hypothetical protein [Anaerolineaceae bacterium]
MYHTTLYPSLLVAGEVGQVKPEALFQNHPFIQSGDSLPSSRYAACMARELGDWAQVFSPEQTACALGYVTADRVLSPLVALQDGRDLLDYAVSLRKHMDGELVSELAMTLRAKAFDLDWEQVGAHTYATPIASGVAVCVEITPGAEQVYLRYASGLAEHLTHARGAVELPCSCLFLQTVLYERFDALLDEVRQRTWMWLYG